MVVVLLLVALLTPAPRARAAVEQFKKLSGYPHGRPGFVVDHVLPLCAGGPDTPANMQWQGLAESKLKDKYEVALCAAAKKQGYRLVKQ